MDIQNVIFKAVDKVTSAREADGSYRGNSHHLSQEITTEVVAALQKKDCKRRMDEHTTRRLGDRTIRSRS
jgi:hypothetical protein